MSINPFFIYFCLKESLGSKTMQWSWCATLNWDLLSGWKEKLLMLLWNSWKSLHWLAVGWFKEGSCLSCCKISVFSSVMNWCLEISKSLQILRWSTEVCHSIYIKEYSTEYAYSRPSYGIATYLSFLNCASGIQSLKALSVADIWIIFVLWGLF